jgi:hypothetical protein
MYRSLIGLVLALVVVSVCAGSARHAEAGAGAALATSAGGLQHESLVAPARVWRDCQRIARCNGCRPVYHCRSCTYQRTCRKNYGYCGWADVCVWGPYLPVAPRGVPIR